MISHVSYYQTNFHLGSHGRFGHIPDPPEPMEEEMDQEELQEEMTDADDNDLN